ncbi:peroxidase-related enzyme [Microbacterium sp. A84]|uniref:peroxidase-related enzyme n=1 Tax=Microbacterium sp. A84 TaxID=3450715 RepID=UPI003F42E21E
MSTDRENLAPPRAAHVPSRYVMSGVEWIPWVLPLEIDELTEEHYDAVIHRPRAQAEYFRVLLRDTTALRARTRVDDDVFGNTNLGLARAERELAATAASRLNGCLFCTGFHAGLAAQLSGRAEDVESLLIDGDARRLDARWQAIVDASRALTTTPSSLDAQALSALEDTGLDDLAVFDTIQACAFFAWANRLMLALGESSVP